MKRGRKNKKRKRKKNRGQLVLSSFFFVVFLLSIQNKYVACLRQRNPATLLFYLVVHVCGGREKTNRRSTMSPFQTQGRLRSKTHTGSALNKQTNKQRQKHQQQHQQNHSQILSVPWFTCARHIKQYHIKKNSRLYGHRMLILILLLQKTYVG